MGTSEFYRTEAERCRALAAKGDDAAARRRWHQLADEYDELARALASQQAPQVQPASVSQPMQQQQSKAERDKD